MRHTDDFQKLFLKKEHKKIKLTGTGETIPGRGDRQKEGNIPTERERAGKVGKVEREQK